MQSRFFYEGAKGTVWVRTNWVSKTYYVKDHNGKVLFEGDGRNECEDMNEATRIADHGN